MLNMSPKAARVSEFETKKWQKRLRKRSHRNKGNSPKPAGHGLDTKTETFLKLIERNETSWKDLKEKDLGDVLKSRNHMLECWKYQRLLAKACNRIRSKYRFLSLGLRCRSSIVVCSEFEKLQQGPERDSKEMEIDNNENKDRDNHSKFEEIHSLDFISWSLSIYNNFLQHKHDAGFVRTTRRMGKMEYALVSILRRMPIHKIGRSFPSLVTQFLVPSPLLR